MCRIMFIRALVVVFCVGFSVGCKVSMDCGDDEGRSLCYEHHCRQDVPCNKDNDCFFYGAADVSQGFPQLRCYKNDRVNSPPGYGVCMNTDYANGLERLPGDDVVDVKSQAAVDAEREIEKFIRSGKI